MKECSKCGQEYKETKKQTGDALFVCENCRCTDCQIVLTYEQCFCGVAHGEPSVDFPETCAECMNIRERTKNLDTDLLELREREFGMERSLGI